jgi:hypothetical protein
MGFVTRDGKIEFWISHLLSIIVKLEALVMWVS